MNKAANIYWDDSRSSSSRTVRRDKATRRPRIAAKPQHKRARPWLASVIVVSIFVMLAVTINYRSFANMREEVSENEKLAAQIQNLRDENLALQEEIHTLKSDARVIEREAKKIGVDLKSETRSQKSEVSR